MQPTKCGFDRAVGSHARVGKRGDRDRVDIAKWHQFAARDHHEFGKSPVDADAARHADRPARKGGARLLMPQMAILAIAAMVHVMHGDTVARFQVADAFATILDPAGILMTEGEPRGQHGRVRAAAGLATDDVQIRPAQARPAHPDQNFARTGSGDRHVHKFCRPTPFDNSIGLHRWGFPQFDFGKA